MNQKLKNGLLRRMKVLEEQSRNDAHASAGRRVVEALAMVCSPEELSTLEAAGTAQPGPLLRDIQLRVQRYLDVT